MNSSELPPDPELSKLALGWSSTRKIPLRHFLIATVAMGMSMFVWYRTNGDALLCGMVAVMTAAVIDVRVSDGYSK